MVDTTEVGAGSYPSAPETEYKCYRVKVATSNEIECIIYAQSEEDAMKGASSGEWEDIETEKIKVEEVLEIKEVKE